ncbi:MAG: hypothetical protein LUQ65_12530 [Candidatus Helarchaeota archaeon]|nr:hypothetical protein [Candidatus Helarchaeota archaeon]
MTSIDDSVVRRLLLAKQLYLHGLDHSRKLGALNAMIAVHNFHNAIEIVLRAIMLKYDIRPEKKMNIEFEVMLNEIDKNKTLVAMGKQIAYRQELRNLNQLRNLVQHHAIEPPPSQMEDWRVFTHRFMERAYSEYFSQDFEAITVTSLIDDTQLRALLELAQSKLQEGKMQLSVILAKLVFEWAQLAVFGHLPRSRYWSPFDTPREIQDLAGQIQDLARYMGLLAVGVNLLDYQKFKNVRGTIFLTIDGGASSQVMGEPPSSEDAEWVIHFVTDTVLHWQTLGFAPGVPDQSKSKAQEYIDSKGAGFEKTR